MRPQEQKVGLRIFGATCGRCGTKVVFTLTEGIAGVECPACRATGDARIELPPPPELIVAAVQAARQLEGKSPEKAVELLHEVLAIDDWNAEAHNSLGILHDNAKQSEDAIRHFQRAVEIEPLRSTYWYELGVAHCYRGDYLSGRRAFETTLEILPVYTYAMSNLMACYLQLNHIPAAVVAADRVATLDLSGPLGDHCRDTLSRISGKLADIASSGQGFATSTILYVFQLHQQNDFEQAAKVLEDCLKIVPEEDPFWAIAREHLAGCYLVLGRFSEAFEQTQRARQSLPCVTALVEQPTMRMFEAGMFKDVEKLYKDVIREKFGLENGMYSMLQDGNRRTSMLNYDKTSFEIVRAGNILRISKDGGRPEEHMLYEDSYIAPENF